jgi:translation initiation factor 1A
LFRWREEISTYSGKNSTSLYTPTSFSRAIKTFCQNLNLFLQGKLRKKVWINQGDIILLSLRDYQDEKGDVILKYSADEARSLKAYGELPESAKINETDTYGHEGVDDNVEFDEDRDGSSDDGKDIDIDEI